MFHRKLSVAGQVWAAVLPLLAAAISSVPLAHAQAPGAKPADKTPPPAAAQKPDEYAEAQHAITGAAGNPECVWLGRRVVSLLWRDDLETAFRHLDLYDRFSCPGSHVQAAFRCLILHAASIDSKAPDSLNGRVEACWINPANPAPPPEPAAAAAPGGATKR